MPPLNAFFLISNTALLVLLATLLLKEHYQKPSAVLGAVIAVDAATIGMFTVIAAWDWRWLELPLNLLFASTPVAFWLLAKSLFDDGFRWKWSYLALYLVCVMLGLAGHYLTFGDFRGMVHWVLRSEVAHNGLGLVPLVLFSTVLVVLALDAALKDWRLDLVESRRRARMVSVSAAAAIMLVITAVEFVSLGTPRPKHMDTAVSGVFFLLIFGLCVRSLGFRQTLVRQSAEPVFLPSISADPP